MKLVTAKRLKELLHSCCFECNIARRDHFTPDEMKIIGAAIRAVKLARLEVSRD
jgi:hypothetical protein